MSETKKSRYEETKVVRELSKHPDIIMPKDGKLIKLVHGPKSRAGLGNKTKGKLDFLVNYCGYKTTWSSLD